MPTTNAQRAEILVQALPYIQKYNNKIVVIKYGGNAMINDELKRSVMRDIVLLSLIGIKVILVHGGGSEISETLERMGKKTEFCEGLRVTDQETIEVVEMVLAGKINKGLVRLIEASGSSAMGLCGVDGTMIEARQLSEKLGFVGEVTNINTKPILDVLDKGYIPVISTIGCDKQGNVYNINADTAAAKIAGALHAESFISMTDVRGVLRDVSDENSLIRVICTDEVPQLIEQGVLSGGMLPKAECCLTALREGVRRVFIIDGKLPHSILIEILTNEGIGTMFVNSPNEGR